MKNDSAINLIEKELIGMVIGRKKIFNRMPLVDLDRKKVGIYFLLSESTIKFKLHGSVRLMDGKGNNYV